MWIRMNKIVENNMPLAAIADAFVVRFDFIVNCYIGYFDELVT